MASRLHPLNEHVAPHCSLSRPGVIGCPRRWRLQ